MHIVVMGCGRVGSAISGRLDKLGHSVAVIDQDPEAFRRLGPSFGGNTVAGVGFDRTTLERAGIEKAHAFAAVSSGDNSNIIAARVAREIFGLDVVVARIYDHRRAEVYERPGIPTIATVPWTVDRLVRSLLSDRNEDLWRDPTGVVTVRQVAFAQEWIGRPVREFESAIGVRVAYVTRFGRAQLVTDTAHLQDGDGIYILTTDATATAAADAAAQPPEPRH